MSLPDGAAHNAVTDAPFHAEICGGDGAGRAYWVHAADGLRLRVGVWKADAAVATVLLYPGRTEYIEKYDHIATELVAQGFCVMAIDWRGQGLADRLLDDRRIGHVESFDDYQLDAAAMIELARAQSLPQKFCLLGHSMGGCIGLRSVVDDMPILAAAFTGPMWGIYIAPSLRPLAEVVKKVFPALGMGHRTPPTTSLTPYVLDAEFDDNMLTRDPEMWDLMKRQLETHPDLGLGAPSVIWLREAMLECEALMAADVPNIPALSFQGTNERIVETTCIAERMENWPGGTLELIANGEHEVLMESPAKRAPVVQQIAAHFKAAL